MCALDFGPISTESPFGPAPSGCRIGAIDDSNSGAHLFLSTKPPGSVSNALVERVRVLDSGYVGVGTSNPSYTLDVAGTARAATGLLVGSPRLPQAADINISSTLGSASSSPRTRT